MAGGCRTFSETVLRKRSEPHAASVPCKPPQRLKGGRAPSVAENVLQYRLPYQNGFTLIEIVIVIAIIIILATLGVGSYSTISNNMAIDFFADNFVSKIHSTRVTTQSQPKCLGLRLQRNAVVKAVESAYKNARTGCEKNKKTISLDLGKNVVASQILLDGTETETADIFFEPPTGIMKFSPLGKNIEITFALAADATKTRTIVVEKNTGKILKK